MDFSKLNGGRDPWERETFSILISSPLLESRFSMILYESDDCHRIGYTLCVVALPSLGRSKDMSLAYVYATYRCKSNR
jgi:hypothetical protein